MKKLSHVDSEGRASMVNVSGKRAQLRIARAAGRIDLADDTVALVRENGIAKGDVLAAAEIAGIQAAKRTCELIPLCHLIELTHVDVEARLDDGGVVMTSEVTCVGRTGVEMEALTAVSVSLLTIYDMCKAVDTSMRIGEIRLLEKVKKDV